MQRESDKKKNEKATKKNTSNLKVSKSTGSRS
jgi:hypothetical protein